MKEIKAIIQPFMLDKALAALAGFDELPGVTISHVAGWGKSRARAAKETVAESGHVFAKKVKLEIVVKDDLADQVVDLIVDAARTGKVGDGKIFVCDVQAAVKIRTGERDSAAV